jgi:hypothetical protein
MTAAWMGFAAWLVRYRHSPAPAYSAWTSSFLQDSSLAFAAWFILAPELRLTVARRVGCAAAAGFTAFLASQAYVLTIITSQGASIDGFASAVGHASGVFMRGFLASGWTRLTLLTLISAVVSVVAHAREVTQASEAGE